MHARLQTLLRFVVEDVIKTAAPVGSQYLVETHELDMSPATIRQWLAGLEEAGYIMHPHTSSGRLPTEKGYRFYVEEIMERRPLSQRDRGALQRSEDAKVFARRAAELVTNAAVLGLEDTDTFYTGLSYLVAQPEFRDWQRVVTLSAMLDRLDRVVSHIRRGRFEQPTALIGRSCPFGSACSAIFLTLSDGTLIGLLGPLRMDYQQGMAILETAKEIF